MSLSGGQKQRLVSLIYILPDIPSSHWVTNMTKALARAVYARTDLAILDDILASLDPVTKDHVFDELLGSRGLFRRLGTKIKKI